MAGVRAPLHLVLCYGIKWSGLEVGDPPSCQLTRGEPDVDVRQILTSALFRPGVAENDESAVIDLVTGGSLVLDHHARTATFYVPAPVGPEELVHPYLVPAAAVFSSWAGREAYHAGAFVVGGKAWALVADKEGGKSTTLAALAQLGIDVLSDDLLVLDEGTVRQGPRLIDLREPAAVHLSLGQPVESGREGGRWRVSLAGTTDAELAGWVVLRWGDGVGVRRMTVTERVALLIGLGPTRAEAVLSLASLPAFELVRPRGLGTLSGAVQRLLNDLGCSSSRG